LPAFVTVDTLLSSKTAKIITDKLEAGINTSYINDSKYEPYLFGELGSALGWSYFVTVTEYPFTKGGQPRTFRGGWTPYQPPYQGGFCYY